MANDTTEFPHQVGGKIREATRAEMNEAHRRFGVTDGALVRKALEDYMPRYLSTEAGALAELASLANDLGIEEATTFLREKLRVKTERAKTRTKRAA